MMIIRIQKFSKGGGGINVVNILQITYYDINDMFNVLPEYTPLDPFFPTDYNSEMIHLHK